MLARQVITVADFHPQQCNTFAFATSKGAIRLADLRASALADNACKAFEEVLSSACAPRGMALSACCAKAASTTWGCSCRPMPVLPVPRPWSRRGWQACCIWRTRLDWAVLAQEEPAGARSFFSELLSSMSDLKFSRDGRHMLARDFMALKLWDVRMEAAPVATYPIHEHLRSRVRRPPLHRQHRWCLRIFSVMAPPHTEASHLVHPACLRACPLPELSPARCCWDADSGCRARRAQLVDLYENDCIFDKFDACFSGSGAHVATGSYSNCFRVVARADASDATLEASRDPQRKRLSVPPSKVRARCLAKPKTKQKNCCNSSRSSGLSSELLSPCHIPIDCGQCGLGCRGKRTGP